MPASSLPLTSRQQISVASCILGPTQKHAATRLRGTSVRILGSSLRSVFYRLVFVSGHQQTLLPLWFNVGKEGPL